MARITRKELKSDKFALEVEHGLSFFEEHQQEIIRYGAIVLAIVAILFAVRTYRGHQAALREQTLDRAMTIQETGVGPPPQGETSLSTFPTEQVKDQAALKAFADVKSKYPGSNEADIAEYYIASIYADQGNLAEAEKHFQQAAQQGNERYASLAKLSLGEVYFAEGKADLAEKTLHDLAAHPTLFVSPDQANMALARGIMATKPAEARKILESLRNRESAVSQVAVNLLGQMPSQ